MSITEVRDPNGAVIRYVAVSNDLTGIWREDEHVRHLAFHDALTDLPNRALLMERLNHQIALALRENRKLALLFLDLDGFKLVNDTLGHNVGDSVLKEVARRLLGLVRHTDTVARLGGDEFVIILDNPESRSEIENIAGRVVAAVNRPINFGPKFAQVGTSIGISVFRADGNTPSELIKSADTAMYSVKGAGKNHFRFFNIEMTAR